MKHIFKFILDNHYRSNATYLFLVLLLYGCAGTSVQKPVQDFSKIVLAQKPILTIDTGGHKAVITDVMFTKDGRYLVSASDDKTVRVWDVETGEVVRVLRGQIGRGDEGKIYAAALSPDNRLLAVGGWLGKFTGKRPNAEEGAHKIRLIDFQTGQVTALLKGHENVIVGLAFSTDGSKLISGSFDKTARIWDVRSKRSLHVLKGHKDPIYAVSFSPNGKMAVTGSDDHTLRLWDSRTGRLIATLKGHKDQVESAAFTPDGRYLLSGSWDKTIRLWDARTGAFVKVLATLDKRVGRLSISPDSSRVVAGNAGRYGPFKCFSLSIPSGERITSFTRHKNVVLATAISPDGKTAATGGGSDMEIYLWDLATGRVNKDMKGKGKLIWSVGFARDGRSIAWGKTWKRESVFTYGPLEQSFQFRGYVGEFSLGLGKKLKGDAGYFRAMESSGPFSIRTKDGKIHPTLVILKNGKVVRQITRGSTGGYDHRSLTLTPDGKTVISGGSGGVLTSYNPETGKKIHDFVGHTGDVFGVAVSPDSRFLVSGSHDQTVRLWEIATGEVLLTIFQGTDNEWVAWTPEGFYAASPGGEGYVGYHINRGEKRAADYVSVAQVGRLFYRPDLVAKKVAGGFDKKILAELKRIGSIDEILASGMPPKITLLSEKKEIRTNSRDITLKFKVEDQGGGIGKIEYRINGALFKMVEATRSADILTSRPSGVIEMDTTLDDGKNIVTATVYNERGDIASQPAEAVIEVDDPMKEAPSVYVLAVGISNYRDVALKLSFAHSDADEMAKALKQRGKGLFKEIYVTSLLNHKATKNEIKKAFEDLSKAKPSDVFVWYLGGHGKAINGDYHFVPWEALYENEEVLKAASLSSTEISSLLQKIQARKSLLILDTCYAGLAASGDSRLMFASLSRGIDEKSAISRLMKFTGHTILAASSEHQKALEGHEGHGVFTYVLLQGLKGKADRSGEGQGVITIDELADYAREKVPIITMKKWGFEQIPMRNMHGDPFPIGCKEGFDAPGCEEINPRPSR